MQNTPSNIAIKIKDLCVARAKSPGDFTEFTNQLMALGVIRQTYDVLEDSLYFYSKDTMLYRLALSETTNKANQTKFIFGDSLDEARVKNAIENLDTKKLSVFEFHRELAQAGIVYVSVFLNMKTIYYFGQDGKYFLEKY
ncbi:Phage envelope protein [Legionella massiliensis]|uniref:Phage envelope protein n=1 Tax=Legionella massiliensis TaxID=1034943 RepID=A0A078KZE3_9GAMM|nr:DUF1398 family protein [Legionella massiliensis]CDZ77154.1 Phage envelope protein [Legionella massiliensis]CEE12892.1 hypothetical protein BN1094_01436 [Legionella massiliensis]